ncbi:glycosyltransferase involved in cell wall biosynthesis [Melghirimyces profundicolus]|uniref:Glycosyltransferase involved in cell wall biosynthesis n=1 Tax=Melghirimyces profundicolus TaxID=1242148 RepID=A0A2T6BQ15_9BACL|nr:glycosyltransferase [Melghirimyces profundicolus]PTX58134.1 glycosyltransferase involved in cell wall biosynthesis [Melghirimyces profundicolus]
MRVLMILFKDIHYDARVQREAVALANAGWYVDIACVQSASEPPPELHERVRFLRFRINTKRIKRFVDKKAAVRVKRGVYRVVRSPMVRMAKDVVAQRNFAFRIWELCENASYEAVHCHDLHTLSIGVHLKRKKGCTLVYDSHQPFDEGNGKTRWGRLVSHRMESWWMESVDHLITENELLEAKFQHHYPDLSITVLRNIPESLSQLPEEKNYFHGKFGLAPGDRVVLYQGGFLRNRGLEELIHAFTRLPDHYKLVLLGFGEWEERLRRLVREKKVGDKVFFHPPLCPRELLRVTSHADLGTVLYGGKEGIHPLSTPNQVFEYIQAGIPAVTSDQPGIAHVVGAYKTGRLVDPLNVGEIASAIHEILPDPDPWRISTHKARKLLNWEKERERLVELYRQINLTQAEQRKKEDRESEDAVSIQPHLRQL